MNTRRIIIVGPSGSGKTTVADMVAASSGLPLISMDNFRTRGVRTTKYFVQHNGERVRNFEHPDLWDGNVIAFKLQALIRSGQGFVVEGNHLLHYPAIAAIEATERYYLHVDHAVSVKRRETRHRYSPADESFIRIGQSQTACWVEPQKQLPRVVVIDGSRGTGELANLIMKG